MNCSMCHLMFNVRRNKVAYACGIGACQECLVKKYNTIPKNCIAPNHQKCHMKESSLNQQFKQNTYDKKIKVVYLGNNNSGKTTLITTMRDQGEKINVKKTISHDVNPVTKIVNKFKVQYALWDTASQISIFASSFESSFKDSKIQVIVFKKGDNFNIIKQFVDETQEHSQNPHIIIVQNKYENDQISSQFELREYLQGVQYNYFWINCQLRAQVDQLWNYFNSKCLGFKQNQSKIYGLPISSLRKAKTLNSRHFCCI